jgi:RNA polymerase sigma-70 factor (ECF subfamily)
MGTPSHHETGVHMVSLQLVRAAQEPAEDEDIKILARADRRRGIDLIVRKYRERILHHALYVLKDYQEAFDVTQEVFIKAMREPRFFDAEFKMKAWLFRVTSNLCFNIVRDRRRRSNILDSMPKMRELEADQFEMLFTDERQKRILEAMDRLTGDHREILMLRYYSDLSYVEIADVLGIKLGTVMSRLSRAKTRLMEVLDEVGVS